MKLFPRFRSGRLLFTTIFTLALLTALAAPYSVSAGSSGCRADPLVVLSDGSTIQVTSSIGTNLKDVQHIEYTIHVPVGVRPLLTVYTDSLIGIHEHLSVVADGPSGQYTTDTVVSTGRRHSNVTTTSNLLAVIALGHGTRDGYSEQHLQVVLRR